MVLSSKTICANPNEESIHHIPGSTSYKTQVCISSYHLPRLNNLPGFDSTYLFATCIIFPKTQDPECIHFTQNHAIILTFFFSLFFEGKIGERFECTPGAAMRSRDWSLTSHKYWQRRHNLLDSMKHVWNPKAEENCVHVYTHIHVGIKKKSLRTPSNNKSHFFATNFFRKIWNF